MTLTNTNGSRSDLHPLRRRWRPASRVRVLALVLSALLLPAVAPAAEITWFGGSGSWASAGNWWPNTVPGVGDLVWVRAPAGNTLWVTYTSLTNPQHGTVHFDSVGSGLAIVLLGQDLLHAGQHNVGLWGRGAMAVSGAGTHQVADLNLGFWGGSQGAYDLNVGGSLFANKVFVGVGGTGTLRHLGGTSTVGGDVVVGHLNGAVGTYETSTSAQLSANDLFVGNGGIGTFRHVDGNVALTGNLNVGNLGSGNGTFELSPAAQLSAVHVYVGAWGTGVFRHSGAALSVPGDVSLGIWGSGNGRYELSDGGSIVSNKLFVGGAGTGMLVQDGSDIDVAGDIVVSFLRGSNGTWELSGTSTVECQNLFVGGDDIGLLTQSSGVNTVRGDVVVGSLGGGNGTIELVGGDLSSTRAYVGSFGDAYIDHSGGTNDVAGLMQIGVWGGSVGTYALSGTGTLDVGTLVLGGFGVGDFVQSGGTATVYGQTRIGELLNSHSALVLAGGSFTAGSIWNKVHGDLEYTGGSLVAVSITNDGELLLGGEGARVVDSAVTNNGLVDAAETSVAYTGGFAHRGQYVSTDADNAFLYMVVSQKGTVVADADSRLAFTGDLLLDDPGAAWDTTLARLEFLTSGDGVHVLRHAGQDLGATPDGFVDNFAWGELGLASGESLVLQGGALYVRVIDLEDGVGQVGSISSNGQNIYYDAAEPGNAYLGGQTHALSSGGDLIPVPEPSLLLGLGAGVLLLSRLRRRGERA